MPVVECDLLAMFGRRTPEGRSILPPFGAPRTREIRGIEYLLPLEVVHEIPNDAVIFGMSASSNTRPYGVVLRGENSVNEGYG